MTQIIGRIALLVRDYEEAINFYTNQLDFELVEDTDLDNGKRWVRLRPPGSTGTDLLLAKAVTPEQSNRVGDQIGGRVFPFLDTDAFWHDYREMTAKDVKFVRPPSEESYATVAVFEDLHGKKWDLLQMKLRADG
jgi:catechol 2,3-dioxygenase-like lactoylglutathione lyase family enzyme